MEFYQKLEHIIKSQNTNIQDISKKSGLSVNGIKFIISGKKSPTINSLIKICNVLNVELKSLFDNNNYIKHTSDIQQLIKLYSNANDQAKDITFYVLKNYQKK